MILTCPECASRYFIDDLAIGPGGKTVRCSSCGASWKAYAEDDEPLELSAAHDRAEIPESDFAGGVEDAAPQEPQPGDLPGAFRARAEERRRVRAAATTGAVWAAIAAVVALAIGALVIFRADVVRAIPKTATAYAAVGLAVNVTGINIEKVEAQPGLQDGRAAVVVTGALRNIQDRPLSAPALRINLLNKDGRIVQSKIAAPADPKIPAGETRHFTISLLDPPSTASDVEVVFVAASPKAPTHVAAAYKPSKDASAPMPALRPASLPPPPIVAEEAKPLVGDAPYALPAAPPAPASAQPHG